MKGLLVSALVLTLGIGVGGGAAFGTSMALGARPQLQESTEFVPTGTVLAPLVFADGRLSGYVSFEVQLEVAAGTREDVEARLPILLNAINMRTYRTPMASGRDGLIPSLSAFRKVVIEAAAETYGKGVIRRAVVTQASPV
ncbi:hypothetical protein [Sphingomonas cavernae]|uniref:Flagellar protein FliL n=1 Tax=Sphingomonas cavernae TaxID=2320861 RepID=A0A418W6X6_9SPHN|nr:hypothetical protein [Sphingomonas cavernae]RJF85718.1 hypothetical protein D3876_17675 [Sphingomonas cavernae]